MSEEGVLITEDFARKIDLVVRKVLGDGGPRKAASMGPKVVRPGDSGLPDAGDDYTVLTSMGGVWTVRHLAGHP